MTSLSRLDHGICLGIGGTNARAALVVNKTLRSFAIENTPSTPSEFFKWMARKLQSAAQSGVTWAVIGLPGVVQRIDHAHIIGPLPNIPSLTGNTYILEEQLILADPAIRQLLAGGFKLLAINDGLLAAYAASSVHAEKKHQAICSFIIGTGVGGSVVRRRPKTSLFAPDNSLLEFGHIPLPGEPEHTYETTISGPALERRYGLATHHMTSDHKAWNEVGDHMGQLIMTIAVISGVDLVVACGGVGSNAYEHYRPYLERYLHQFQTSTDPVHRHALPEVVAVSPTDSQKFELRGAEPAMRYYLSTL